jgi:hypothetical protein
MEKRQLIGTRPHYFRGQLLLEDDFIAEQNYHGAARCRHTLNLHGWGVVRGLAVTAAGDTSISVSPGFAVDGAGQEIELRDAAVLDLSSGQAGALLYISLVYESEPDSAENDEQRSRNCYAVVRAAPALADAEVLLATVRLDERGRVAPAAIDTGRRRQVAAMQRRGWIRVPFRPVALLPDKNKKDARVPPTFLVGATRAEAQDGGAGGTMAIPLPPESFTVHRFRIAGETNARGLKVQLWIGGWNTIDSTHAKRAALDHHIEPQSPFDKIFDVAVAAADFDPESSTMSLEIHSEGSAVISLVAVEISCRGQRW